MDEFDRGQKLLCELLDKLRGMASGLMVSSGSKGGAEFSRRITVSSKLANMFPFASVDAPETERAPLHVLFALRATRWHTPRGGAVPGSVLNGVTFGSER